MSSGIKMKLLFICGQLLITNLCFANMASPVSQGTFSSSAFSSRDIDILKEKIHVTIDKSFKTAFYKIEYFINTESEGNQIPLLFFAMDYKGDFKVWVDDSEVIVSDIPAQYLAAANSPFSNFTNIFSPPSQYEQSETVTIYWSENQGFVYQLNNLKYFESNLSKGKHTIRVEYEASVWTDVSGWIKEYSFRYSLSPAKFWKSFGSMEVVVDASQFHQSITTNFNQLTSGKLDSVATWSFENIPANYFQINYVPAVSSLAKTLIQIGPDNLAYTFIFLFAQLHLFFIYKFRKNNLHRKLSWTLIVGSLIIPFLTLLFYMNSFGIIDSQIGAESGRYHGYVFLNFIFYPAIVIVYFLVMWFLEKIIRRRF